MKAEIFGEVGHITVKPRTVTARAETKCIVKVIDEDTLKSNYRMQTRYVLQSFVACQCGSAMQMPRPSNIGESSASTKHWKLTNSRININHLGQMGPLGPTKGGADSLRSQ